MNHDRILSRATIILCLFTLVIGILLWLSGTSIPGLLIFVFVASGLMAAFFGSRED